MSKEINKELSIIEDRCHEEAVIESAPHAIRRIRDEILEAKKEIKHEQYISIQNRRRMKNAEN